MLSGTDFFTSCLTLFSSAPNQIKQTIIGVSANKFIENPKYNNNKIKIFCARVLCAEVFFIFQFYYCYTLDFL